MKIIKHVGEFLAYYPFLMPFLLRAARFGAGVLDYLATLVTSVSCITIFVSSALGIIYYINSPESETKLAVRTSVINFLRGVAVVPVSYLLLHLMWSVESTTEFVDQYRWWLIGSLVISAALLGYSMFLQNISEVNRGENNKSSYLNRGELRS